MPTELPTSLGPSFRRVRGAWTIDLTDLPLFHGLSVLSRALGERIVEHCLTERLDIDVERRIKSSENPELAALGCVGVKLLAERDVVAHVPDDVEGFQHHLRAVFGTLQRERWRTRLFPGDPAVPPEALVFTFPTPEGFDYRFVLDRVPAGGRDARFYLRIAVENPHGRRLDLASVRHVIVDDLDSREYLAGSTRIAQTVRDITQREAARGRRSHVERQKEGSFIFTQLGKGGLGHLQVLHLTWTERFGGWLAEPDPTRLDGVLKRVLLLLEDQTVRAQLRAGATLQMASGSVRVYLDLSQQQRVLNLAFDQPRRRATVDAYLERMPMLAAVVKKRRAERPLAGLKVLLIHHITSEVLGLVAALRALGADDLTVLFVRYGGEIPNEYMDAILDLEPAVRSLSLQNLQAPEEIEGHFVVSRQFSAPDGLETLAERLRTTRTRYMEAMQGLAVGLALQQLGRLGSDRRLLVVEDGGYLMPLLTKRAAEGATVGELAAEHGLGTVAPEQARRPLRAVLEAHLVGSVEHTRNGFDRLTAAGKAAGGLIRPAYSIATSRLKVEEEAGEVAAGVLAAVEAVYHALGMVLSRRQPLVIGSRGAIGSRLVSALGSGRLRSDEVLGLDLRAPRGARLEARSWRSLPVARRRAIDLVLGVTGASVLGPAEIEELILHGSASTIVFASGSTKTAEFRGVADYVERLLGARSPRIGGRPVEIVPDEVVDPQSGRNYGTVLNVRRGARTKRLVFVANMTPVNFLFYGVPTEAMDPVMAQLLRATLGLLRAAKAGRLECRLYAVDRDVPDRRL
ncbi:MAG: hypothetical protein ACHQKZ_09585 [Solirubrobacterales bacterium]|jgi:hypothetical protein